MNKCKTKVMIVREEEEVINIPIEDINIEQVKNYKYLRAEINVKKRQEIDINDQIEKTLKLFYAINVIYNFYL